ncbi:MAG: SurA N-terminal domain-containing protein, partial [Planctomycetota bacterium]
MVQMTYGAGRILHRAASASALLCLFVFATQSLGGEKGEEGGGDKVEKKGDEGKEKIEKVVESLEPIEATVNGAVITHFDIEWEIGYVKDVLKGTAEERKKQLLRLRKIKLRELMIIEILIQAAKRKGIRVTDSMVRQELRSRAKQAGGTAAYYRLIG